LDLSSYSDVQIIPIHTSQREPKMMEKGKKLQLAVPKRSYEKPVLILLNAGDTLGKKPYTFEDPASFFSPSGPS
jgi:hypothetical protein